MQTQKLIRNDEEFPDTHYFIYLDKKFPIKIDFFRNYSELFSENQVNIIENKNILLDDDESKGSFNLSNESIQNFINYVHRQDTYLNNDNVIGVNYLAKKYKVYSLIKATEEYINEHHLEILIPIFLINQNNSSFDTNTFENIISDNLDKYIDDDRLLDFNIQILYRIFEKYSKSEKSKNGFNQKVINFLFKCLDKHKRDASVLFTFIGIEKIQSEYLKRLLTDYSEIFDFHFINSSLAKNLYEIQNEMILKEQQSLMQQENFMKSVSDQISQMRDELNKMKNINDKLVDDQKRSEEQYLNEINAMKGEIDKLKSSYDELKEKDKKKSDEIKSMKGEIDKLKSSYDELKEKDEKKSDEIKSMKGEIDKLNLNISKLTDELKEKEEKNTNEINTLKSNIDKMNLNNQNDIKTIKDIMRKTPNIVIPYSGLNNFGVFDYFKKNSNINNEINITASSTHIGNVHSLLNIDNTDGFYTKEITNSWICIEFKTYTIIPTNYTLKSHNNGPGGCQPKSWVIEGSNDNIKWNKLDEKNNCSDINGRCIIQTFHISKNEGCQKYIRIRQTDKNWHNDDDLTLCSIELYGQLFLIK